MLNPQQFSHLIRVLELQFYQNEKSFNNFGPQTCILAVYKYSRRLLKRVLPLKFEVIIFHYDFLATGYSLSDFNLLESHMAQKVFFLVSKSVFSFFEVFIFLRIQCAKLKMCQWIYVNIRYLKQRSVKFRK